MTFSAPSLIGCLPDNAWEATTALKNFLGPYYSRSDENMLVAFYKNYRDCIVSRSLNMPSNPIDGMFQFVEDGPDVVFYKNAAGVAQRVAVEETGLLSDSGIDMSESK